MDVLIHQFAPALEHLLDAALIGDGWEKALDRLSAAAGSRGVIILHNRDRRPLSALANEAIREPVQAYLAGKAPPNSRQTRVSHDTTPGFRSDHHDYDADEMARDPFYQDYLRPIGLFWHANARLQMEGTDEVAVSFKRERKAGPYQPADLRILDGILVHLRTAARITDLCLQAEVRGMVRMLHQRGRPVLEFDAWGRVRRQHGSFDGSAGPIAVIGGRAIAAEGSQQATLDRAIARAARTPQRQVAIMLRDGDAGQHILQLIPVTGRARDVFLSSSALGVLAGRDSRAAIAFDREWSMQLFGLSLREAQIAELLCGGMTIPAVAVALGIVPDTVRYHLKGIFEKTEVKRQAELVALFAQLAR